jgi:hypothetical protein
MTCTTTHTTTSNTIANRADSPVDAAIGRSGLLAKLDAEWTHLRTSRRALRTARGWAALFPGHPLADAVTGVSDLDHLVSMTQRSSGLRRRDDEVLLALIELSRRDELAGRVVLQHLLPALISRSMHYRSFHDRIDPIELVVPAAWMALRTYDVERRRHHVASSLLSDAVFQAFRRPLRRRSSSEEVRSPGTFASTPAEDGPTTPLDEFVTVLREATQAGVPSDDIDLLRQLVRVGSPGRVAAERRVTPRTVRNHRDRAIGNVRAAVSVAA